MGVETQKFIRKPLYVDAVRVTAQNFDEIAAWCQGEVETEEVPPGSGTYKKFIKVRVHLPKNPRQTKAFIGDWVLYTERGYKVYTNGPFRKSFDEVVETAEEPEQPVIREDQTELASAEEIREKLPHAQDKRPKADEAEPPIIVEESEMPVEVSPHPVETAVDEHTTPQGEPHEYVEATPEAIAGAVRDNEQAREREEKTHGHGKPEGQGHGKPNGHGHGKPEPVIEEPEPIEETPVASPPVSSSSPPSDSRLQTETGPDQKIRHEPVEPQQRPAVSEQPPEVAAAGKHVLSEEEQRRLGPDKVRELVTEGDAVLAQDLAESA